MIPFTSQDLFARTWAGQGGTPFAPHAPFIGSFHPQIPQGLLSSYAATNPWIGSAYGTAFGGGINPIALALQSGLATPYAGWQNAGLPFNALPTGGFADLSTLAALGAARQAYLPGFYPTTNFLPMGPQGLFGGNPFGGASFGGAGFGPAFGS